jgi:hypothetical protein
LIPLHFNSCISNVYKKPQGGGPRQHPKFVNSSLAAPPPAAHTRTPATPIPSMAYFTILWIPGGGVRTLPVGQPILAVVLRSSRATGRRPRVAVPHWSPGTVAPQSAKCQNHGCYCFAPLRETYPPPAVSNARRADIGFGIRRLPNPVARRSRSSTGVARARRPGSNVLT